MSLDDKGGARSFAGYTAGPVSPTGGGEVAVLIAPALGRHFAEQRTAAARLAALEARVDELARALTGDDADAEQPRPTRAAKGRAA